MQIQNIITSSLVDPDDRLNFLPTYFGERLFSKGEQLIFTFMSTLCDEYNGGYWEFYTLSNGGFFLAPKNETVNAEYNISVSTNMAEGTASAMAAGIIITLFAISYMFGLELTEAETEKLSDHYHQLREFACSHEESSFILRAID